jgi:hypothetical protein
MCYTHVIANFNLSVGIHIKIKYENIIFLSRDDYIYRQEDSVYFTELIQHNNLNY